jgi:hypothetical protein
MWNFKAGDKVFCVWPKKDIGLDGGEHIIRSVEGKYVTIEGISRYLQIWRFMKVPDNYINPTRQQEIDKQKERKRDLDAWDRFNRRYRNTTNGSCGGYNSSIGYCGESI